MKKVIFALMFLICLDRKVNGQNLLPIDNEIAPVPLISLKGRIETREKKTDVDSRDLIFLDALKRFVDKTERTEAFDKKSFSEADLQNFADEGNYETWDLKTRADKIGFDLRSFLKGAEVQSTSGDKFETFFKDAQYTFLQGRLLKFASDDKPPLSEKNLIAAKVGVAMPVLNEFLAIIQDISEKLKKYKTKNLHYKN
jgi:hypothetical protein